MPDDATEGVAEQLLRLQPPIDLHAPVTYSLYVQLLWYSMCYPEGMKTRVSPVQSIEPHRILAPTWDLNQGLPSLQSRVVFISRQFSLGAF